MKDSELQQLAKTDRNQSQETRYQELLTQAGIPFTIQSGRASVEGIGTGGNNLGDVSMFSPTAISAFAGQKTMAQIAEETKRLNMEAIQPGVDSLNASIPEIQTKYQQSRDYQSAQKEPLKQRYANLLNELKVRESGQVDSATLRNAQEFSRRGIPLSSTSYTDANIQATNPINQFYSGQYKDVSLSEEQGLSDIDRLIAELTTEEVSQVRGVKDTVGQMQSSAGLGAIDNAMNLYNLQKQTQQNALARALQVDQFEKSYSLDQQRITQGASEFEKQMSESKRQYDQNFALQQAQFNRSGGASSSQTLRDLQSQLLGEASRGATIKQLTTKYGGSIDLPKLLSLYTAVSPHGVPKEDYYRSLLGYDSITGSYVGR